MRSPAGKHKDFISLPHCGEFALNVMNYPIPNFRSFIFGFTAAAALLVRAQADTVPAPVAGEVFAGFRASGGQGASTSYLIKLGADTTFRNAAQGTAFNVAGLGNVGADLTTTFGSDWHTRSDLQWGIFAVRSSVSSTVYGSRARTDANTVAPAWPALTATARNGTAGAITSVLEEVGGYKNSTATANSTVATLQTNFAGAASYNFQVGTPGTSDFGSISQWTSIEGSFAGGAVNAVLDLYRIGAAVSHVGSFSINSSGVIRFTAVPLPANSDTDGDGYTDAEEALAGTNPNSGSDFFRAAVTVTGSGPRIQTAVAAANKSYVIEYSETLAAGSWVTVSTHNSGTGAAPVDFTDTDPVRRAKSRGFYRVRVSS
jgi:Bacterial TSP3 repeat